jgi:hypothetical protein
VPQGATPTRAVGGTPHRRFEPGVRNAEQEHEDEDDFGIPLWSTMVRVRRFPWLAVIAVTLVVFGVGLAALFSTGEGTGHPPAEGYAVTTTTLRSVVPTNRVPSDKHLRYLGVLPLVRKSIPLFPAPLE